MARFPILFPTCCLFMVCSMSMARRPKTAPGAQEIQRERLRLNRRAPQADVHESLLGDVIPRVMKKMGLEQRFWEQSLIAEWEDLVGPQVARHSRPGRLDRKRSYARHDPQRLR